MLNIGVDNMRLKDCVIVKYANRPLVKLSLYIEMKNDKKNGTHIYYHNDKRIITTEYINDIPVSKPTQNIKTEHYPKPIIPNIKDGVYTEYFKNGKVKIAGNCTDGKKTGDWKFYEPGGKLVNVMTFDNDRPVEGNIMQYYDDEAFEYIWHYERGQLNGYSLYQKTNGAIYRLEFFNDVLISNVHLCGG